MVTTNDRSPIAASIKAVAAIWVNAPATTHGQKNKRKRKAEQKTHLGGADGAEPSGQLALHRIADGLGEGGGDSKGSPEPGRRGHADFSATTM